MANTTKKTTSATKKTAATEKPVTTKEKTYTEDEVKKIVEETIAKMTKSAKEETPKANTVTEEFVTLLYIGVIAQGTSVQLGKLGSISKAGGTRAVPKKEFIEALGTPVIEALLSKRRLIVIDGLTEEERERYDIPSANGDVLTQTNFLKLMKLPDVEKISLFKKLCPEHQNIIAKIFRKEYFDGGNPLNMETVKTLNDISKEHDKNGMFTDILKDITSKYAE